MAGTSDGGVPGASLVGIAQPPEGRLDIAGLAQRGTRYDPALTTL